jgi:L-ribulose-5-phosphate 3-epimerase
MISRRDLFHRGTAALATAAAATTRLGAVPNAEIKPAVLISMLPQKLPYIEQFKLAVEVGFRYMEVMTFEDDKEAGKVKDAADMAGLRIHSVMNMRHWDHPLSSPNPKDVELSVEGMRMSLRQAKLYGAETVLLVPGVVRDDTTYEDAWIRSQKAIRPLIPEAEKLNVTIAIEEVWNKFLLTPTDFVKYIDEFDSPVVKAYFDVGNVVQYAIPQHWIRALGKRIVKVHLKDYSRRNGFVGLGEGDVNWPEVRKAFADIGYTGVATAELDEGDKAFLVDVHQRIVKLLGLSNA